MKTSLHTLVQQGSMDFLAGYIALKNREERDIKFIEESLDKKTGILIGEAEIRSLIAHEVTHLFDLYTTLWGLEYVVRKNKLYQSIGTNQFDECLETFMTNTAELEAHSHLLGQAKVQSLIDSTTHITHQLIYDDQFGVMIIVNYMKNDDVMLEVPLSMLSLLETNATASEYISRINDAKTNSNSEIELYIIEKDFRKVLNDTELSEYSLLLFVLHTHFGPRMKLDELLRFASALVRVSLDYSSLFCASFGATIRDTFQNKALGYDICMDLSRGMSRQVIFFKVVLLMYGWLENQEPNEQEIFLCKLRMKPGDAIALFFKEVGLHDWPSINDLEYETALKLLKESTGIPDYSYAAEMGVCNRELLKQGCVGDMLNIIHLPTMLLDDDSEVTPAQTFSINHLTFVKNNVELYAELDSIYRKNKHKKDHPSIGTGIEFFNPSPYFSD